MPKTFEDEFRRQFAAILANKPERVKDFLEGKNAEPNFFKEMKFSPEVAKEAYTYFAGYGKYTAMEEHIKTIIAQTSLDVLTPNSKDISFRIRETLNQEYLDDLSSDQKEKLKRALIQSVAAAYVAAASQHRSGFSSEELKAMDGSFDACRIKANDVAQEINLDELPQLRQSSQTSRASQNPQVQKMKNYSQPPSELAQRYYAALSSNNAKTIINNRDIGQYSSLFQEVTFSPKENNRAYHQLQNAYNKNSTETNHKHLQGQLKLAMYHAARELFTPDMTALNPDISEALALQGNEISEQEVMKAILQSAAHAHINAAEMGAPQLKKQAPDYYHALLDTSRTLADAEIDMNHLLTTLRNDALIAELDNAIDDLTSYKAHLENQSARWGKLNPNQPKSQAVKDTEGLIKHLSEIRQERAENPRPPGPELEEIFTNLNSKPSIAEHHGIRAILAKLQQFFAIGQPMQTQAKKALSNLQKYLPEENSNSTPTTTPTPN